jgi:hypothetical protein
MRTQRVSYVPQLTKVPGFAQFSRQQIRGKYKCHRSGGIGDKRARPTLAVSSGGLTRVGRAAVTSYLAEQLLAQLGVE